MLIEIDSFPQRQWFFEPRLKEILLHGFLATLLPFHPLSNSRENGCRIYPLMDVQGNRIHIEARAFRLPGPIEIGLGLSLELLQCRAHDSPVLARQRIVKE